MSTASVYPIYRHLQIHAFPLNYNNKVIKDFYKQVQEFIVTDLKRDIQTFRGTRMPKWVLIQSQNGKVPAAQITTLRPKAGEKTTEIWYLQLGPSISEFDIRQMESTSQIKHDESHKQGRTCTRADDHELIRVNSHVYLKKTRIQEIPQIKVNLESSKKKKKKRFSSFLW